MNSGGFSHSAWGAHPVADPDLQLGAISYVSKYLTFISLFEGAKVSSQTGRGHALAIFDLMDLSLFMRAFCCEHCEAVQLVRVHSKFDLYSSVWKRSCLLWMEPCNE